MHAGDVDKLTEQGRAQDDREHHGRGAGAVREDLADLRQREVVTREREQQRGHRADARGLDRGEQAAVDAAHDDGEDGDHGPQRAHQVAHVHLHALGVHGRLGRVAPDHVAHGQQVAHHGDQPRHDAGCEQLADVRLRGHAIDHHDHRGRDQDAQRAARRHGGGGELVAVTEAAHFGNGYLAHGGRRGHAGAADGAECAAGRDGGHGHTAAAAADHGLRGAEQIARDAGARDQVAHEHEQRQDDQRVHQGAVARDGGRHAECGRPAVEQHHTTKAHEPEGGGNGHLQEDQREGDEESDGEREHVSSPPLRARPPGARRPAPAPGRSSRSGTRARPCPTAPRPWECPGWRRRRHNRRSGWPGGRRSRR